MKPELEALYEGHKQLDTACTSRQRRGLGRPAAAV